MQQFHADGVAETSLESVLTSLTRAGVDFDRDVDFVPADRLAMITGPALIIGPHSMLSVLFLRELIERGGHPLVISVAKLALLGSGDDSAELAMPGENLFVRVRRAFLDERCVCTMIDRGQRRAKDDAAGPERAGPFSLRMLSSGSPCAFAPRSHSSRRRSTRGWSSRSAARAPRLAVTSRT